MTLLVSTRPLSFSGSSAEPLLLGLSRESSGSVGEADTILTLPTSSGPSVSSSKRLKLGLRLDVGVVSRETGPTPEQVKHEIGQLEHAQIAHYIRRFDLGRADRSLMSVLQRQHPWSRVTIENIAEGVTNTKLIKLNGVAKYVLKCNALPESLFEARWQSVRRALRYSGGTTLAERVRLVFVDNPGRVITQEFSHYNQIQREKLAYVIGKRFGVPQTRLLRAREGYFSLQNVVPGVGSTRRFDVSSKRSQSKMSVQDVQNIGCFYIYADGQDRNPGNIVVSPKPSSCFRRETIRLTPVDHALTFQQSHFEMSQDIITAPCWLEWDGANVPLTAQTKRAIRNINPDRDIAKARREGLVIDRHIETRMRHNAAYLQKAIRENPRITLKELYEGSFTRRELI